MIIGIDPGLTGAIAIVVYDIAAVYDMPVNEPGGNGYVKRTLALDALVRIICSYTHLSPRAYIEKVNAFPGQGVSSMFSLGMSFYGAAGVCAGLGIPVTYVLPRDWKGHFGLIREQGETVTKFKKRSLVLARKLFPDLDLAKPEHHGRAEALLIARYAQEKLQ